MKNLKIFGLSLILLLVTTLSSSAFSVFILKKTPVPCPEGRKPPCNQTIWCLFCDDLPPSKVSIELPNASVEVINGVSVIKAKTRISGRSSKELSAILNANSSMVTEAGVLTMANCKRMGISEKFANAKVNKGNMIVEKISTKGGLVFNITITATTNIKS